MHLRAMLDKLGIEPHISKIREYKGAAELVMETEMTDPVRAQAQRVLERNWDEVTGTLERERGLTRERLLAAMDHAALLPQQAREFGLIDGLLYWQDLQARLLTDRDLHVLPTVTPADYRDVAWKDLGRKGKATVAVIHAQGTIAGRESGVNPLLGITMGHETVVADLQRARFDDEVKAIVLRVDSPGGEGLASDLIGHEVALCAAAKPTVVSMGDVAASGGYQIAFRATRLLADPLSVVGSIGSISGYFDLSGLYDRIGMDKDGVEVGPLAGLGRDDRAPTDHEWEAFTAAHEAGFADWLHEVAEERGLTFAEAEQLAYGRVFTGREAVANGLIDGLGNLQAAIREAAGLAGVAPETALSVVHLPAQPGLLESLFGDDPAPGSPVTAAARYLLHKQLRTELMETRQLLQTEVLAR
jgi:protease-4